MVLFWKLGFPGTGCQAARRLFVSFVSLFLPTLHSIANPTLHSSRYSHPVAFCFIHSFPPCCASVQKKFRHGRPFYLSPFFVFPLPSPSFPSAIRDAHTLQPRAIQPTRHLIDEEVRASRCQLASQPGPSFPAFHLRFILAGPALGNKTKLVDFDFPNPIRVAPHPSLPHYRTFCRTSAAIH